MGYNDRCAEAHAILLYGGTLPDAPAIRDALLEWLQDGYENGRGPSKELCAAIRDHPANAELWQQIKVGALPALYDDDWGQSAQEKYALANGPESSISGSGAKPMSSHQEFGDTSPAILHVPAQDPGNDTSRRGAPDSEVTTARMRSRDTSNRNSYQPLPAGSDGAPMAVLKSI